jgi:hypothetical protein
MERASALSKKNKSPSRKGSFYLQIKEKYYGKEKR